MRKLLTAAMAAITLGGAVCATAAPAEARPHGGGYYGGGYGGGYYGGRHHNDAGVAVAAGVVGLALGAALASNHGGYDRGYYDRGYYGGGGYYDGGYYGGGYYPGYYGYSGYRVCEGRRWVWDPYIGRRVLVRSRYEC
ncbi:MAG: hypothetical protein JWR47_1728 [Phenylobacterium sp.]|nr:hypothetical protein [Phenylobacterium sp.]MDB5435471.1 hypothetical protein [Phenylobacterium sp.]MDB5498275.1 hypothetical protein [Phenylobacterium sp.]